MLFRSIPAGLGVEPLEERRLALVEVGELFLEEAVPLRRVGDQLRALGSRDLL